jgi:flagellar export protein FliJ
MSAFRFRLESVLKMKEDARHLCRHELARANQAADILKQQQTDLSTELQHLGNQLLKAQTTGEVAVDWVMELRRYEVVLKLQIAQLGEQLKQVEAEVERRRELLAFADQEVRVLERLRASQKVEWQKRNQRIEQNQSDEVASQMFLRQKAEEAKS